MTIQQKTALRRLAEKQQPLAPPPPPPRSNRLIRLAIWLTILLFVAPFVAPSFGDDDDLVARICIPTIVIGWMAYGAYLEHKRKGQ